MRVFLKVESDLSPVFFEAGRRIGCLEWVDCVRDAEAVIVDQVVDIPQGRRVLFVGSPAELEESVPSDRDEWDGHLYLGRRYRFQPSVSALLESLQEGQLGDLGILRLHRWFGEATAAARRRDDLLDAFDVALQVFGSVPDRIYALTRGGEGTMQLHFGFPGNGMAVMDFAWELPAGRSYESLHLIGDRGAGYADDHRNMSLLYGGNDPLALPVESSEVEIASMLTSFLAPRVDSEGGLVDGAKMRLLMLTIDAAYRSAEEKQALVWTGTAYVEGGAQS